MSCLAKISRKRATNSARCRGSTAVSSTNAIGFLSPFMPSSRPSPALRRFQIDCSSAGVVGGVGGVAEPLALPARLERFDLGADLALRFARVLDDHDRRRVALDEAHALGLLDVAARQVEDHLVGQLDRVRARLEDRLRGLERFLDVAVVDDLDRRPLRSPHQPHLRLDHRHERALRADDEARHVQGLSAGPRRPKPDAHQLVQVVAGHATPVRRIARADLVAVGLANPGDLAVDLTLQPRRLALGGELLGRHLAENDP